MNPTSGTPRLDRRGLGALAEILGEASCHRVLVISGPSGRFLDRLANALSTCEWQVFSDARRHVPSALVERAREAFDVFAADAVISLGGGSATGLAKALRRERSFFFVAVPTTYAGSEMTDLFGTTSDGSKRTGRDPRVVPDVVSYDLELTLQMPLDTSMKSGMNALAHPVSALSTGKLDGEGTARALEAAATMYGALSALAREPRDEAARRAAIEGTIQAGTVLRIGPLGMHHELAHALGGYFDLDHAGLHAVLLPFTVAELGRLSPEVLDALERRLGGPALAHRLLQLSQAAGAPISLAALGVPRDGLERLLAERPQLPRRLLERAFAGRLD
ncbi:MAG TPA: iron-containing alcohol dehydrogenase [Polyangiaceae bacterium]|nr:iron-containing alcohol dehydrogenase [Polyangiaceae bacterium]